MLWMSIADFMRVFHNVDICRVRTGWAEVRDSRLFSMEPPVLSAYEVELFESTSMEMSLYQRGMRGRAGGQVRRGREGRRIVM